MKTSALTPIVLFGTALEYRGKLLIVSLVLLFHVTFLWVLQNGSRTRSQVRVVPVHLLAELIELQASKVAPLAPERAAPSVPVKQPVSINKALTVSPALHKSALVDNTPSSDERQVVAATTSDVLHVEQALTAPTTAVLPVWQASSVSTVPAKVELPSSNASYLQNPEPVYPPLSKRLGEQGLVVCRVLIDANGLPVNAQLLKSSGFIRLDEASLNVVMLWRYAPGTRNGVTTAMSVNVPINWVLE